MLYIVTVFYQEYIIILDHSFLFISPQRNIYLTDSIISGRWGEIHSIKIFRKILSEYVYSSICCSLIKHGDREVGTS